MERKLLDLYDKYRHGLMGRREFLARLSLVAGGVMAANSLFWMFEKQQARADLTSKNDPRLSVDDVKFPGFTGEMLGKLARPTGEARHPGVIVIHENKGLNA